MNFPVGVLSPAFSRQMLVSVTIFFILNLNACHGDAAAITGTENPPLPRGVFASSLVSYTPAPGQFVQQYGDAANALGPPDHKIVSLGGFGGAIVVAFPSAIPNRAGADFVVWGNALYRGDDARIRWAEPAQIEVSSNGTDWLVIVGSLMAGEVPQNLQRSITYTKTNAAFWPPSAGTNLTLSLSGYDLTATFCKNLSINDGWSWTNHIAASRDGLWGYADATPSVLPLDEYWTMDQAFILGTQGAGGDAIDLDWARHADGSPASASDLTNLRFVRLTCAVSLVAGDLGELSSEIDALGIPW